MIALLCIFSKITYHTHPVPAWLRSLIAIVLGCVVGMGQMRELSLIEVLIT